MKSISRVFVLLMSLTFVLPARAATLHDLNEGGSGWRRSRNNWSANRGRP